MRGLTVRRWLCGLAAMAGLFLPALPGHAQTEGPAASKAAAKKAAADEKKETPAAAKEAKEEKPAAKSEETAKDAKDGEKKTEEKAPPAPVRNPLTDLIKRALQPGKAPTPVETPPAAQPGDKNKTPKDRHATDPRAPYSTKVGNWLRRLQTALKDRAWRDALDVLPRIAEQTEDSLTLNEAGKWVSVRAELRRLLGESPEEFLSEYRLQYGGLAKQLLMEANRSGDPAAYGRIAGTYFHTEAGYAAADRLGTLHLDRGEFALASYWLAALWQAKAPITREAAWRTKAAYALKQSGETASAAKFLGDSPDVSQARVDIGGASHVATDWLSKVPTLVASVESSLAEWQTFYGNSRRAGIATGGEPLLMPRWRQSITENHTARTQIEYLLEDLGDQAGAHLPLLFPTLVAGKVIFRTLHGVVVADAESGRVLWETHEDVSPEQMLTGTRNPTTQPEGIQLPAIALNRVFRIRTGYSSYNSGAAENSPLCNLLFRNLNFGTISSDGRQVFVLEDLLFLTNRQPGQNWGWDGSQDPPSVGATKLTSYDLATGRPLWEIGGMAYGEAFDRRLAGHFFFGPPTADGDELFVVGESTIGERSGEIRLFCLDPQNGAEKWSQLLAFSQSGIEKDTGRRWWSSQPAFDRGVIVCPTTVGWVIGLDRVTRSILWGYRVPVPNSNNARFGDINESQWMVQYASLNQRWSPAPPIISGGRVVFTPLESANLVCLDLATGKELWTKPRGNAVYLAGVVDGTVLVAGQDGLTAYALADGVQRWAAKTPIPSGRGVVAGSRYYLPLAAGQVWGIDLANGNIASKSYLPAGISGVGNLGMYRGALFSLDALGLTAFEQRDAIREEIAKRTAQNPRDTWALLRETEIHLLNREVAEALKLLRAVVPHEPTAEETERLRTLKIEALTASIQADFSRPDNAADLRELLALTRQPAEKLAAERLQAELLLATKEFSRAFEAFLALANQPGGTLIAGDSASALKVRAELWAAGRIQDLLAAVPNEERGPIDARIAELAAQANGQPPGKRREFAQLFGLHPAAAEMRRALVEDSARRGEFILAEHLLRELQHSPDRATAAAATERLARLMSESKLYADAAGYYRELEQTFADAPLADGNTGAGLVAELRSSGKLPAAEPVSLDWHAQELRLERSGGNNSSYVQELEIANSTAPYFRSAKFDVKQVEQRLEISSIFDDEVAWSLPLRSKGGTSEGGLVSASSSGRLLTVLHRGVIHGLSPVERKVLWTHPLESRLGTQNYYGRNQNPIAPMQQATSFRNRTSSGVNNNPGMLGVANHQVVCYLGRRTLNVLDALSGEIRWTYYGVRPGSLVFGNEQLVFLRPADGSEALALRTLDGKPLKIPGLVGLLDRAVQVTDRGIVVAETSTVPPVVKIRLHDPIAGKDVWSADFPRGVLMSNLDQNQLALFDPAGKFSLLNLASGAVQNLGEISADDLKARQEVIALADNVNVYLIINRSGNQNYYSEQVPFVRANGAIFAFDPRAGKLRWKQAVTGQNLVLERIDFSPFLLFATRKYEQKGNAPVWSLAVLAVDKTNGTKLLDVASPSQQPGFRSVTINAAERFVELRTYNERVRLYPVDKQAAAGQSSD